MKAQVAALINEIARVGNFSECCISTHTHYSIVVTIEEPHRLNRIVTSLSGEFEFSPPGTCHFEILLLGVTIMN